MTKGKRRRMAGTLWTREIGFGILLAFLLLQIFLVIPFAPRWGLAGKVILGIVYFVILTTGINSVLIGHRHIFTISIATFLISILFSETIFREAWVKIGSSMFFALYNAALATVVLIKVFATGPITSYRIQGAVVVYLLISLVFTSLYQLDFLVDSGSSFKGLETHELGEFSYFSLVTLTTTGYGDIVPTGIASRCLSNLESLIGVLYPAILISRLVSLRISSRS